MNGEYSSLVTPTLEYNAEAHGKKKINTHILIKDWEA